MSVTGVVRESQGGVYRIALDPQGEVEASLRGRLKQQARTGDRVVIGDRVRVGREPDGAATIDEVLPRRSQVLRRGPGGRRPKVVAANVDRLVVVMAVARPDPGQSLLDRLLVVGESNGLETVLVFNKADLEEDVLRVRPLVELYRGIGYPVLVTSARTGDGVEELRGILGIGVSALVGPSGAGKSSLLNAVQPGLGLRTGELSHRVGRGRQTTTSARLLTLDGGGMVADTPGFSDVGLWGVEVAELEGCFPEFEPFRGGCRFSACSHTHEPGCAVRGALEDGRIDQGRFLSYRTLREEAG